VRLLMASGARSAALTTKLCSSKLAGHLRQILTGQSFRIGLHHD
jgi:hypothetical protein